MKLSKTIKRIVALGTGATMLGATVLGAMAADLSEYPKPMFIKDGKFDGLIVIGADADTQDMLGAMDIISSLQAVAVGASGTTLATVQTVGDVYEFAKASDKLNMGEKLDQIRSKVTKEQLPIVLANGELTTAKGASYEYEQEVAVTIATPLVLFADKDYENEKPTIGIKVPRNGNVLNYTLDFSKDAKSTISSGEWNEFEDRSIEVLGEVYDIIDTDEATIEMNLMRGALKPTLEEGETATYKINGKDYEVTALIIQDTGTAAVKFKINGEVTDSMVAGDIYKTSDGTLIGVREIMPNEAGDVTQDMVEFYVGAKKIDLTNNDEVELDDEDVTNLKAYITNTSTSTQVQIDKIVLEWKAEDDLFITEDKNEVVMPGLESVKFYMDGFYKGKQEIVKIYATSDDTATIEAPLNDYDVKLDVLYASSTAARQFDYVGSGTSKQLVTDTCTSAFTVDMDTDEYFVVTKVNGKDAESSVLTLTKVHDTDGITIKDYDGNVVAENKKSGKTFDASDMSVAVNSYNQSNSSAKMQITDSSCRNSTLVTKEGMRLSLPTRTVLVQQGAANTNNLSVGTTLQCAGNVTFGQSTSIVVNLTAYNGTYNMTNSRLCYASQWGTYIAEEDKDENIAGNYGGTTTWNLLTGNLTVNATFNSDNDVHTTLNSKTDLSGKNTFSVDDTKVYVGMLNTTVSSKVTEDKTSDQNDVEIEYPGEETYANLFIGSKASKVTSASSGESVAVSKIEVGAAVLDSSLASYTNQNLIVVGGPAINRAAAALLGKTYPAYGAASGIPENAGLIKLVENADKVAMIVAGWEAADTQRACRVVAESSDYALSGKEVQVTGTSMTDIQVGVPA